jgi:hypothetical protein
MITLGNNMNETHSMFGREGLTYPQWAKVVGFIRRQLDEMGCDEESPDYLENFGGVFKIVEDNQEDFTDMMMHMSPDIRVGRSKDDLSRGFDFVHTLQQGELYIVGVCTNNQGGNHYIITGELIEKYPLILTHMELQEVF